MRIQNPKRTIIIGLVVWLLFFGWWFRGFLFRNWRFRLFSYHSWRYLIHEFNAGWQISSRSDWIFVCSFIAAPFIFAWLWYLAEKIHWKKLWKKIWRALRWPFLVKKQKELKQVEAAYSPKQPAEPFVYRPQAIPTTGVRQNFAVPSESQGTFLSGSRAMGDFDDEASDSETESEGLDGIKEVKQSPKHTFTNEAFAEMADTPLSEIEIPKMERVDEDIPILLEQAGYTLLPNLPEDSEVLDFVAASASEVLIVKYDREDGDWLADEESFNDEDPLWFSETDHRRSPVFELKMETERLQEKLGDEMRVHPLLIEKKGTIINAEDMMKTWNDLGVSVCRTDVGGPVELPTTTEILKEPQDEISDEALEKLRSLL